MLECNSNGRFAVKRFLSCQHLIKHNSDRIYIALFIGHFASCLFGTDIVNRADSLFGKSFICFTVKTGNAEIHDLYRAVGKHHYVLRLYIPVDDSSVVCVL